MKKPFLFIVQAAILFFSVDVCRAQTEQAMPAVQAPAAAGADAAAGQGTDKQTPAAKQPAGDVITEKVVDSSGNVTYKKYRYGYQYKGKTVTAQQPEGDVQRKETQTTDGATDEGYRWGFQYSAETNQSLKTPSVKPKTSKFQAVKRTPIVVAPTETAPAGSASGTTGSTPAASGTSTSGTAPSTAPAKTETPAETQKKILEMIKQQTQKTPSN